MNDTAEAPIYRYRVKSLRSPTGETGDAQIWARSMAQAESMLQDRGYDRGDSPIMGPVPGSADCLPRGQLAIEFRQPEKASLNESDEAVDHPRHYGGKDDPFEAIKVMEAWGGSWLQWLHAMHKLSPDRVSCMLVNGSQVLKYLRRFPIKGDPKENLRKARWHLDRMIESL